MPFSQALKVSNEIGQSSPRIELSHLNIVSTITNVHFSVKRQMALR